MVHSLLERGVGRINILSRDEAKQDARQGAASIVPADTAQEPGSAPLVPPAAPQLV